MMEAKITIVSGSIMGILTQALLGNIFVTLSIALMSGAAAYTGQQMAKYVLRKLKGKKIKIKF